MALADITLIDKNECVGNSLSSINTNFTTLTSEIVSLSNTLNTLTTQIAEFSAFGVSKINVTGEYISVLPSTGVGAVTLSAGNPYTGQELISASNIGASYGAGIYKQKNNKGLQFKKLISGSTNIEVKEDGDNIKITGLNSNGTPLGEANTTSNKGSGIGLAKPKNGTDLPFKTFIAGNGVSITSQSDTITLSSTVSGTNIGVGTGEILKASTHPFEFRKLKSGKNINIITSGDNINITATDSVSAIRAHPDGAFIFKEKSNDNLIFKTLIAANPHILIEEKPHNINISTVDLLSGGKNTGSGKQVLAKSENNCLFFRSLSAGKNIDLYETSDGIRIESFVPAVAGFKGVNVGTGTAVFSGQSGYELHFKSLSAGNGIQLTENEGTLGINVTDEIIYKTVNAANLGNGLTHGIFSGKSISGTLQFKSLSSIGNALKIISNENTITFDSTSSVTNGINSTIGTGSGKVLKQNLNGVLEFKKLKAGEGIVVNNGNDDITISAKSTIDSVIPAGAVMPFARKTPPAGWLVCNGDIIPNGLDTIQGIRADFSALYTALGTSFGSLGQLPDLRGEFIRGWDADREIDKGRVFGSLQQGTAVIIDPNKSSMTVCSPINRIDKIGGNLSTSWLDVNNASNDVGADHVVNAKDTWPNILNSYQTTNTTSGSAIELNTGGFGTGSSRPRNIALLYCIKY
jgi:hypothetical protein